MMQRGSAFCALVGRWGLALSLVIGAVLLGRIFRDMPYLLPNRLPGIVLYEMGPGLLLAAGIGCAVAMTPGHCREVTRVVLFTLAALIAGTLVLGTTHSASLAGQWL